jgi:hypothetical protein
MAAEELVPVPVPALVALLLHLERQKGLPLTEAEVWEARDKAVCIMMPISARDKMAEKRGYPDIDLENAWTEWQAIRPSLA